MCYEDKFDTSHTAHDQPGGTSDKDMQTYTGNRPMKDNYGDNFKQEKWSLDTLNISMHEEASRPHEMQKPPVQYLNV